MGVQLIYCRYKGQRPSRRPAPQLITTKYWVEVGNVLSNRAGVTGESICTRHDTVSVTVNRNRCVH